jgi:hypothetical protein
MNFATFNKFEIMRIIIVKELMSYDHARKPLRHVTFSSNYITMINQAT